MKILDNISWKIKVPLALIFCGGIAVLVPGVIPKIESFVTRGISYGSDRNSGEL